MKIMDLFAKLRVDDKGLKQDAAKAGAVAGKAAGAEAGKGITGGLKKALGGGELKQGLVQGLGLGAALGGLSAVTTATSAFTAAIFDSIDAASDQREAMSLTTQVFEENTDEMSEWAEGSADAFGESKTAALNFAATFGGVFKGVGEDMDSVSKKSQTLTRLAADLGSAFNTTGEEAATAIRSGLIGESEPLRRYNVLLSEAAVKNEAVASGIAKTGDELTDQQKVLARYSLIMKQTADSQGMFGRDSESLADAQKRLQAQFENVQAEIGQKLLPIMVDLAEFATDEVVPAISSVGEAIGELSQFVDQLNEMAGASRHTGEEIDFLGSRTTPLGQAIHATADALGTLVDDTGDLLTFWDGWTLKAHEADGATAEATAGLEHMADATKDDLVPALETAATPLRKVTDLSGLLKDRQYEAANAARTLKDAMLGQANSLIDDYYEPIELRDRIKDNNEEIRAARKILRDKTVGANEREQARDTIRELTKENEKAALALIATGEMSDKSFKGFIKGLDAQIRKATGDAKRHLLEVRREALRLNGLVVRIRILQQVTTAGIVFTGVPTGREGRQHGGPVAAGVPYVVGERRPELFVPEVSGHVYSSVQAGMDAMSTGGGDTVINMELYGQPRYVERPSDIAAELRRVASVGVLRPRRRSREWER